MVKQWVSRILIGFFVVSLCAASGAPSAKAQDVMQCMTECVKHEGNTATAKSTCKLRCANIAVPRASSGNQPDCMGTYKACNRSCAKKDKACKRQCKSGLMNCK